MEDDSIHNVFRFFTEVGIIAQFSARLIEKNLPERITHLHFGLLGHMSRRPDGETPQQLAYAFQVPKTSMTHMIRVLEAEGYIEIVPNPEDARSKLAKITPKGGELLMRAYAKSAQDAATMDPPLLVAQIEQCLEPLAQIRAQLDAARDKSG